VIDEDPAGPPAEPPAAVVAAHVPVEGADRDRTRWFFPRFAGAIVQCYRTMDPVVAQVVAAHGVTPVVVDD
jgi:hypothetical protein